MFAEATQQFEPNTGAVTSRSRRLFLALSPCLLLSLSLLAGCDWPGKPKRADRPIPADKVTDFFVLYKQNCAGCHGADGKLGPAPPLNDRNFLAMAPDDALLQVVMSGRPGTPMPAFAKANGGMLTAEQVHILAAGIKPRWNVPVPAHHDLPPYLAPEGKPGNRAKGTSLFAMACAGCHGSHGQGGKFEEQDVGAINDPAFLSLISDQALRRIIITGRPDLGMPDYASQTGRGAEFKALTSQDIMDLVAVLAYWRQGGAVNGK